MASSKSRETVFYNRGLREGKKDIARLHVARIYSKRYYFAFQQGGIVSVVPASMYLIAFSNFKFFCLFPCLYPVLIITAGLFHPPCLAGRFFVYCLSAFLSSAGLSATALIVFSFSGFVPVTGVFAPAPLPNVFRRQRIQAVTGLIRLDPTSGRISSSMSRKPARNLSAFTRAALGSSTPRQSPPGFSAGANR